VRVFAELQVGRRGDGRYWSTVRLTRSDCDDAWTSRDTVFYASNLDQAIEIAWNDVKNLMKILGLTQTGTHEWTLM
jgi:hypothetical protein